MEGFFATGKVDEIRRVLHELGGSASDAFYFVDEALVPVGGETKDFGNSTYLRNALDRSLALQPNPAILWLITDNQPSVGNQTDSDRDISQFYDRLRSDTIKRLYFFPLRVDFEGKLFRADGHQVLAPLYTGKRGLLIYALLLDESAREEFERTTGQLQSRYESTFGEIPRVLIKPLAQDTVTARVIPGDKFRLEDGDQLVAGDFKEGAPISGTFEIELTSQLGQMKISRADIDVRVPDKFRTADFTESEIIPEFSPHDIQNFEPQNKRRIEVKFNAPGVHIRNNPISWWNCITHNRGDIDGSVRIKIDVPGQNFGVVNNLANKFSTTHDIYNDASESVQSRIYRLDDLVRQMMPDQAVNIRPQIGKNQDGNIPVRLVVLYPKWPVVVMIIGILVLLLLLLVLRQLFIRPRLYRLTWDDGRYRACPDFRLWPLLGQRVDLDDRKAATIKRTLSGIRVNAAAGFTVDEAQTRLVSPGGTDFTLYQIATAGGTNFCFSSISAAVQNGDASQPRVDDILGDVSYARSGTDGGDIRVAATAPPIRKPTSGTSAMSATESTERKSGDESNYNLDDLFS
jgi:hypothetical protein